jgi:hypothetical protein
MEAMGIKLLQRLSSSLMPVEEVATAKHRNELREFRRRVDSSLDVLKALGGYIERASVEANASSTTRKKSKAPGKQLKLDPQPFECMGITVPTTEREAHAVFSDILLQLQGILGVRLSLSPLSRIHKASGLSVRPTATRGIGCIQTPTQRVGNHDGAFRIHGPADQGRSLLQKRRGVRRVEDPVADGGTKVPTRSST